MYSFATTVLGTKMLDNVAYGYNQSVAFSFMQQLLVKSALREWGDNARAAGEKEVDHAITTTLVGPDLGI
jgi:hypothetical protein